MKNDVRKLISTLFLAASAACFEDGPEASLGFVTPEEGGSVYTDVDVKLALTGVTLDPQGTHLHLMIDEPWTLRADRGFLWLGHRLAQGVEASPPFESRQMLGSMITISTPLVDHVTADPADVRLLLARLNAEAVGSAYVVKRARAVAREPDVGRGPLAQRWSDEQHGSDLLLYASEIAIDLLFRRMPGDEMRSIGSFA